MGFPVEQIFRDSSGNVVKRSTVQDAFVAKTIGESPRSWNLCDDGLGLFTRTKKGIGPDAKGIKTREFRFMTQDDLDEALLEYDLIGVVQQT